MMALHGTIMVNAVSIGFWEAVRTSGDVGQLCRYRCMVVNKNQNHRFEVEHHYDDGAVALAAKVLLRATELSKPPG